MENKKHISLYIHGLDSSVNQKKIEIIQYHSETVYLNINYYVCLKLNECLQKKIGIRTQS